MFKNNLLQVDVQVNQNIQDMLRDANINVDFNENLSDSQKKALELFKEGNNLLILGSGGVGKCLKFDTPIIMFDGTIKKVQDIQEGELLMGDDSTPRKVLKTTSGRDIMYEVKNVKGESYVVNSHHILSLKYSNKKSICDRKTKNDYSVRWFNNKTIKVETKCFSYKNKNKEEVFKQSTQFLKSIIEDRYVDIPIKNYIELKSIKKYLNGYFASIDFQEKTLKLDPYMIGFWLGDGTSNISAITTQDSTIIKYFKTNLEQYKCYLQFSNNMCYRINGNGIANKGCNYFLNILKEYNLINNKHIPLIYKCNSRENRLKLLAGLLDSDGNLDKSKASYEFTQGLEHEQIIDDVIYLCRSLGFACYKNKKQTSWTYKGIKKQGEAWRICISGKGIEEIPVLCPRKKASPRTQIKDVLVSGITVTKLDEDDYYGFELDGNHRFVLGNFIVTHNSHLIKTMEEYVKTNHQNKKMYLSSTTGISAYNIGGMTIHSFMGIGTGDMPIDVLISRIKRRKMYRDRIINTDILVIDEVSMLSGELFEKLNLICQNIRKSNMFFGGIQVIFTGDFLQLLPVFNKNKDLYENIDDRLIIESPLFNRMFNDENIIILKENFRQKNDSVFINVLLRIRDGTFTEDDINVLKTRQLLPEDIQEHVHLVSSNKKAQTINDTQLNKLKTPKVKYTSSYTSSGKNKEIKELLTKELQFQFTQKGINELILKKGARVMLIKNLDVSLGLVNGAIGTIVDFIPDPTTDYDIPIVNFDNSNIKHPISVVSWELEIDGCKGMANQIPLMLAYSITTHRSQSLSLDSAVLDLADAFCDGQVYVALSRLRSLDGLYLKSFNPAKIKVNKKMRDFLTTLN
jgi:hypothetical protein